MFLECNSCEIPYSDPWALDFGARLKHLDQKGRRVAYFYEQPDNSTFRYRVYNMIQALEVHSREVSAAYFTLADLERMDSILERTDILVICRTRYTGEINRLIARAKSKKIKVYFDVDDLVFDPDFVHLVLDNLDQDLKNVRVWDHWFAYISRIGATMRLCDRVLVTNKYLLDRVVAFCDKPTYVVPNFINWEQFQVSKSIYEQKRRSGFKRDGQIHLGYFSGTPTHNKDFDVVSEVLASILRQDPRVRVCIAGYLDLRGGILEYKDRIDFHPFRDFVNLQRLIGLTEFNLVPLQDTIFTNCKSELKYFEAGIAGTITLASPTYVFRNAINDGVNGYLANAHEWEEKIVQAVQSMNAYPELAEATYLHSEENYSWLKMGGLVEEILFS